MKKLFAMIAMVFGVSSAAHAGILIEPYLGYGFGSLDYKTVGASQEYTDNMSGPGYGLRLGYQFILPWVALDYTGYSGTGKPGAPGEKDYDYSGNSLGAVVGVDLPVMFRFWAGYGFSNNFTQKGTDGAADIKAKGTYTKVGVGWTALPILSINFEYQMNDWKKVDAGAGEVDMKDVFSTFKHNMYLISISAPFDL